MSAELSITVDVEETARRVVANPSLARFSVIEQWAVCQWVLNQIDAGEAQPLPASLAVAVALAIETSDILANARRSELLAAGGNAARLDLAAAVTAFNAAFLDLKTRFEMEFPHADL